MSLALRLNPAPTASFAAVALGADGQISKVVVSAPVGLVIKSIIFGDDLLAKDAAASGAAQQSGERWITIHPNGADGEGQPVKIRESRTEPGVFHVVAGAGGKLNYLKLTNVKSPEEYKTQAKEKTEARKKAQKDKADLDKVRRKGLTPEERQAESAAKKADQAKREEAAEAVELQKREFIKTIAQLAGWDDNEWQFKATADRLKTAGADKDRIASIEHQHFKRVYARAEAVVNATKRQLLLDHETRAEAGLADLPMTSDDPSVIALADLDPDKTTKGLGYRRDIGKLSDNEMTRELAAADVAQLHLDLEAATDAYNPNQPATEGRVARIEAELRTAELIKQGTEQTPEQLTARDKELTDAIADLQAHLSEDRLRLEKLRKAEKAAESRGDGLDPTLQEELHSLESDHGRDTERLKNLHEERDAIAVFRGDLGMNVRGEREDISKRRQSERESELRAEGGEPAVQEYRAMRERLQQGLTKYRLEVAGYKARGDLRPVDLAVAPITNPGKAADILRHGKAIQQFEKKAKAALKDEENPLDLRLFGKGYFVETRAAAIDKDVERELSSALAEARTTTFLRELESSDKDPSLLQLSENERRDTLQRHLAGGTYNALNSACLTLTKQALLSRDVVDVLGAAGSAQLLARAVTQHLGKDGAKAAAEGLADYHLAHHLEASQEAVRAAQSLYEQAAEIELGASANPADLQVQQELNAKRRDYLLQAREVLGRTLGELEATAALELALKESPRKQIDVNLGPLASEAAIRQARAIGLGRDDYTIDSDGTNRFLRIHESGVTKLVKPVDANESRVADEVDAIKAGERDEENWIPPGLISRPATSFTDPKRSVESLGYLQHQARPLNAWGSAGRTVRQDVEEHIGARIADGESPNDILPDVLSHLREVPEAERVGVVEALDAIMPTEVNGKRVKAETHQAALNGLAERFVQRYYGSRPDVAAFHAQSLKMGTPEDMQKTAESMHLALVQDPRCAVAFKDAGELTTQDQAGLRHYFNTAVAKVDPKTGVNKAAIEAKLKELGAEPKKESTGLFGAQTSPEWVEWNTRRNAILAEQQDQSTNWNEYVHTLGGVSRAYGALQDRLKHEFIDRFRKTYAAVHGEPLRVGKRSITNSERHVAFVDPAAREKMAADERRVADSLRNRTQGRYSGGSVKEKVDRLLQAQEIERQNQMGFFGGDTAKKSLDVGPGDRLSLGERAENQLGSLMQNVGQNLGRHATEKVGLFHGFSMSGKMVGQQRAVKMFLATKRMNAALGTGSGKTPIQIGSFTAAASDPKTGVKRGIFIVPSQVQGQFHGELARFVKPGTFNWHAAPGASADERMAVHRDPNTHMVVMTHQGFRDDMLKLLHEHSGRGAGTDAWFMGLPRKERAAQLREAWKRSGIDYQASFVDEGHQLLDRAGKPDSMLSAVLQAVTDNTPYYMSASADPAKNDISEIRSQLDKIHTDGRFSDQQAWHKRYGLNTTASRDALQREVRSRFIMGHITPPITATRSELPAELHPEQEQEYGRVMGVFNRARADRARGTINVEAIKTLSPVSFEGKPAAQHQEIARRLSDNLGILKESALNRVINLAPADKNGKIQAILTKLKAHPVKDKPVIIFAHNLAAVHHLEGALKGAGHRVVAMTGEHAGAEKGQRIRQFQPEKGQEASADVLILSDAGATGLNLQRGQTLINYDTPMTAMVHAQRNGRINRLGQTQDVDLEDLTTDTPFEQRARQRMNRKYDLRSIFTDPGEGLDDTGLAGYISRARQRRRGLQESKNAKIAA